MSQGDATEPSCGQIRGGGSSRSPRSQQVPAGAGTRCSDTPQVFPHQAASVSCPKHGTVRLCQHRRTSLCPLLSLPRSALPPPWGALGAASLPRALHPPPRALLRPQAQETRGRRFSQLAKPLNPIRPSPQRGRAAAGLGSRPGWGSPGEGRAGLGSGAGRGPQGVFLGAEEPEEGLNPGAGRDQPRVTDPGDGTAREG